MPKPVSQDTINTLRMLEERFKNENGEIIVSYEELGKILGLDKRKATKVIQNYRQRGYIDNKKVSKGVTKVIIFWDKIGVEKCGKREENNSKKEVLNQPPKEDKKDVVKEEKIKPIELDYTPEILKFNGAFGEIKVLTDKRGEPWFVARDVAKILGYRKASDMIRVLDEDEAQKMRLVDEIGRPQEMIIINESGLYSAILRSNKPQAKKFKKWVTSEVLPAIRKHGAYITPEKVEEMLQDPDAMIKVLEALKKEREEKRKLQKQLKESEPYIEFGKAIETTEGAVLIEQWVKSISRTHNVVIGRNHAFRWLRAKGYLRANNQPYQRYIDRGWFEVIGRPVEISGSKVEKFTPLITPKGQIALTEKIVKDFKK